MSYTLGQEQQAIVDFSQSRTIALDALAGNFLITKIATQEFFDTRNPS